MSESGKSSDKIRAVTDPPLKATVDGRVEVDPERMLKVWADTADVFRETVEGMERNSEEMHKVIADNARTRQASRNTRRLVLGCCLVTAAISLLTANEVKHHVQKSGDEMATMLREQRVAVEKHVANARADAQETRRIAAEVGKKADALTQLQAAVTNAQMAEQEALEARGSEVEQARERAVETRETAKKKMAQVEDL